MTLHSEVPEQHWAVHCRIGRPVANGHSVAMVKHTNCTIACPCSCHWTVVREKRSA